MRTIKIHGLPLSVSCYTDMALDWFGETQGVGNYINSFLKCFIFGTNDFYERFVHHFFKLP